MNKPREFWIADEWPYPAYESDYISLKELPLTKYTHVIERKAYDDIAEELSVANKFCQEGVRRFAELKQERDQLHAEVDRLKIQVDGYKALIRETKDPTIVQLSAEVERLQLEVVMRNQYKLNEQSLKNAHEFYQEEISALKAEAQALADALERVRWLWTHHEESDEIASTIKQALAQWNARKGE